MTHDGSTAVNATISQADATAAGGSRALILRGGGVRGVALIGALSELNRYFSFDTFVGTSGGAITAVLLAAGFSCEEIQRELFAKDFRSFLDASKPRAIYNLFVHHGLYRAVPIQLWVRELLARKIERVPARLCDLTKRAIVYATSASRGTRPFDGRGEGGEEEADIAARASMAIPYFFTPVVLGNQRTYDGGLRHNFPLGDFVRRHPGHDFIAIYLGAREQPPVDSSPVIVELLRVWLQQEELDFLNTYADQVVVVDTSPVRTTDFDLTTVEKEHLVMQGRVAALRFLKSRHILREEDEPRLQDAEKAAAALREQAVDAARVRRSRRRRLQMMLAAALLVLLLAAMAFWYARRQPARDMNVDEIKWVMNDATTVDAVRQEIYSGGLRQLVPGYELASPNERRLDETNIYFDTPRLAFYHDDINLILKTFLSSDGTIRRATWLLTQKRSSRGHPSHGWYREELTVDVPLVGIRGDDPLTKLGSVLAQCPFPPPVRERLAQWGVDTNELRPIVLLGVHRDEWIWYAQGDPLRRQRVIMQLSAVAAMRFPEPHDRYSSWRIRDLRRNAPTRWWEIEMEERIPLNALSEQASLWRRVQYFRDLYRLRESDPDMAQMAKYETAVVRLGIGPPAH